MSPSLATGVDLVDVSRFRELSHPIRDRFFRRVFTEEERIEIGVSLERAAGFFAAKEALAKALGCGIGPISWQEIEIQKDNAGKPGLRLSGKALKLSDQIGIVEWSLSISHTKEHAIGLVVGLSGSL